jgi:hypothetical protein
MREYRPITGQIVAPEKKRRSRELRRVMTPEERILWQHLRGGRCVASSSVASKSSRASSWTSIATPAGSPSNLTATCTPTNATTTRSVTLPLPLPLPLSGSLVFASLQVISKRAQRRTYLRSTHHPLPCHM